MKHIVRLFDDELRFLEERVLFMGKFAVEMINNSVKAMLEKDVPLAKKVMEDDLILDNAERQIDEKCTAIIAKRQPMAVDLRMIIGSIRIATDLERIGDKAKNIAKRAVIITKTPQVSDFFGTLLSFSEQSVKQLELALDAYQSRSLEKIQKVLDFDKETNSKYDSMFRELLTYMMENPANITACTHLLFCAKNLERVGDHATNVVESLYYIITGQYLPLSGYQFEE